MQTLQISRASTREIGKSTTCEWHQGKKGAKRRLISKKESAGKDSDFCLSFCKKTAHETFYSCPKKKKAQGSKIRTFHT